MALQFVLGNSGSGKSTYLYKRAIKEALENPNKNYLILVPEQFTMQTQRELVSLHPRHAIMNVDVLSFHRLALRVFDEIGKNDFVVLEETGKNLVLRKVASQRMKELKVLGSNFQKMGYINEVKSLISELTQYNIGPDTLETLLEEQKEHVNFVYKMKDVLVMYRGFLDYMKGHYITSEEILGLLSDVAHESTLLKNSVLVLDGYTGFTPIQNQLLEQLFPMVDDIILSQTIDIRQDFFARPQIQNLFYMSLKTIQGLTKIAQRTNVTVNDPILLKDPQNYRFANSKALFHLEQNLFRKKYAKMKQSQDEISITVLKNPKEELEFVSSKIKELVEKKGYRYKDFAIVTGDVSVYSNYAPYVFADYEIPIFMDEKRNILFQPFTEFIRAILEILEKNFSYESIFRYLKTDMSTCTKEEIDLLENYVLACGIKGFSKWKDRWIRLPKNWSEDKILILEGLRQKVIEPFLPLKEIFSKRKSTVKEKTLALYQFIVGQNVYEQLMEQKRFFEKEQNLAAAKEYEQIYTIVMQLFEKMVDLLGEEEISLKDYSDILDAGFEAAKVGVIPPGYDRVLLGDIERTRLEHVKVLFFIGLNDGIIPKSDDRGGILSQLEREDLAEHKVELAPTAREKAFIQKFYLYLNMTKPSDQLYLTYAQVDAKGKAIRPSYLVKTVKRMFEGLNETILHTNEDNTAKQMYLVTPKSAISYFLRELEDAKQMQASKEWIALYAWYDKQKEWTHTIDGFVDALFYRHEREWIPQEITKALYGTILQNSVTRLEKFASCAFAHFLSYGLKLNDRQLHEFAAPDLGNVLHQAMELYSKKLVKEGLSWFEIEEHTQNRFVEEALEEAVGAIQNNILFDSATNAYMQDRMRFLLKRTVETLTTQIKKGSFIPENYEISFSVTEDLNAMNFKLNEDESMRLKGRIDRMDLWKDADDIYVKIIDYKSGSSTKFELISIYHGLQLQLVVYLNAAMEMVAKKNPQKEIHPAGIFYYHMDDPLIEVEEEISEDEIKNQILAKLKLDGFLNQDNRVIEAMDRGLEGSSLILPVGKKKDGSLKANSNAASEAQINQICKFVDEKITDLAKDMVQGNIDVSPYKLEKKEACTFCPYNGICGFDEKLNGFSFRKLEQIKDNQEIIYKMGGNQNDGISLDETTKESN